MCTTANFFLAQWQQTASLPKVLLLVLSKYGLKIEKIKEKMKKKIQKKAQKENTEKERKKSQNKVTKMMQKYGFRLILLGFCSTTV